MIEAIAGNIEVASEFLQEEGTLKATVAKTK
jgi:hypothetical protein